MRNFKFWATIVLAFALGLVGFLLGGLIDYKYRAIFALVGVLIGLLSFARLSLEIAKQFTHASKMFSHGVGHDESFGDQIIIDTSSIIDGRILDIGRTGFLCGTLLLPKFVLTELQQVADSADPVKRSRGRRGFDIVNRLKKIKGIKVKILGEDLQVGETVDEKLVNLARSFKAKLLTADFNLNRVAKIRSVQVLNINELSNSLKTLPVPGETITVKVLHKGKETDQGVGYLPDGTMVIIQDGSGLVGKEKAVEVSKILQVPSGRMVFGKITNS